MVWWYHTQKHEERRRKMTAELMEAPAPAAPPARQLPWSGIMTGEANGDLLDSTQMLQRANLDWEVGIRPFLRTQPDGTTGPSKKMMETYRLDTGDELGAVRHRYEVLQNREAFTFGDSLVENGTARWAEAGLQNGGTRVFATMLLNERFTVLGSEPFQTYLFLSTSHDGGRSLKALVTPIRVWCTNQTAAAQASSLGSFTIQHTSSMQDRLAEAGEALRRTGEYQRLLQEEAERLAATPVTDDKARYLITSLIPQRRSNREKMIEGILSNYQSSPNLEGLHGTGWGLVNAASEYMQHVKPSRSGNARFESITFGEGMKLQRDLAVQLAGLN